MLYAICFVKYSVLLSIKFFCRISNCYSIALIYGMRKQNPKEKGDFPYIYLHLYHEKKGNGIKNEMK